LHKNGDVAANGAEDAGFVAAEDGPTSPGTGNGSATGNGYALTDVIDDLMAAEFPETTAPQADSEEVVLLSPTPPTLPPPPPPLDEDDELDVDRAEVDEPEAAADEGKEVDTKSEKEDGDHPDREVDKPEVDKPEVDKLQVAVGESEERDAKPKEKDGEPDVDKPEFDKPEVDKPEMDKPKFDKLVVAVDESKEVDTRPEKVGWHHPDPEVGKPEVDKPEVAAGESEEADKKPEEEDDGEHVAAGHHESRVTLSGPLQFMGRSDLPRGDRDDASPPPASPVQSPVKLLDVLPATLRDAAAAEASLGRAVPLTSGSIDAVSDTQSPAPAADVCRVDDVFRPEPPPTAVNGGDGEAPTTDVAGSDAVESTASPVTVDVPEIVAAQTVNGANLSLDSMARA